MLFVAGMVAFKGRESAIQYMKDKPGIYFCGMGPLCVILTSWNKKQGINGILAVKRGLKVWIRCDSHSGYMHQFEFYLGKKGSRPPSKMGLMFDVIDRLTRRLHGKYFRIYFDNAYTSIHLLLYLYQHKVYGCGTTVLNRKLMPAAPWPRGQMQRGDHKILQDRNHPFLTLTAWQDTKMVRFASTMSDPATVGQTMRRVNAEVKYFPHPHAGMQYSKNYAGVDRFDQKRAKYRVGRFSRKSWKYQFHFLLNAAIVNSWILYQETSLRQTSKKNYAQIDFRHDLIVTLIGHYSQKTKSICPMPLPPNPDGVHVPGHDNVHMQAKRPRRCAGHKNFSTDHKTVKQTVFGCKVCNVFLCKTCHAPFHLVQNR